MMITLLYSLVLIIRNESECRYISEIFKILDQILLSSYQINIDTYVKVKGPLKDGSFQCAVVIKVRINVNKISISFYHQENSHTNLTSMF